MPQRAKPRRIKKRADYLESLDAGLESGHIDLENLIFIDESGCKLGETSDYGYGQSGKRVSGAEQKNKGHNISVVSAISTTGVLSAMFCNCTFDASAFECFLESHLLPTLRPGNILILDNVGFHKINRFQESMEKIGVKMVFLPPYSPDLNPIENMWSKIKNYLRRIRINNMREFKAYLKKALDSVTGRDCEGWFAHCGYT